MLEFLLLSPSLVLSRPEMEEVVRPSMEITVPEAVPRTMVPVDFVSRIPVQVSLENPLYSLFFEKASEFVGVDTSECARFVNRIFGARFGVLPFGDAWTMQTAKENQKFLTLVWRLAENEYDKKTLQLRQKEDRVKHFEELYSVLEREEYPIGVLGFLYHFSPYIAISK